MSSGTQPSKAETRACNNKRKRKNAGEDLLSIDSMSPTKRILRSATATPVKVPADVEEMSNKANRPRDSKRNTTLKFSPRKTSTKPQSLPIRLMNPKEVPATGKITSYSKPELLVNIAKILRGTKFFDALINGPLGSLWNIPACKVALSGKLLRNMLCRMLPTRKQREIWFLVANKPIRLSLKEFALATGLPCGQYPTDSFYAECKSLKNSNDAYWNKIMVGSLQRGQLKDIENLLWRSSDLEEERNKLSMTQKMRLCLILLVDGVLCPKTSTKMASRLTVEMVKNVGMFMKYPWGRDSFELTLEMVRVSSQTTRSIEDMVKKLKKKTHVLVKGLTIAFQLLIFETVPAFSDIMFNDNGNDRRNVANSDIRELEQSRYFDNKRILQIDNDPNTEVISLLEKGFKVEGADFSWADEVTDPSVDFMLSKIKERYHFTKRDWSKGTSTEEVKAGTSNVRKNRSNKPLSGHTANNPSMKIKSPKYALPALEVDFAYDPQDQIQAFYYPTLRKNTDEKNKRDVEFNEMMLLRTLKELSRRTRADIRVSIEEVTVDSLDTKATSERSESESINQRRKGNAKSKGKAHMSDDESEGDDEMTESDQDEFLRKMEGNTSNFPPSQANQFDVQKEIQLSTKEPFRVISDHSKKDESDNDEFIRDMAGNTADIPSKQDDIVHDDDMDSFEAACDDRKEITHSESHEKSQVDIIEATPSGSMGDEGKRDDIPAPTQEIREAPAKADDHSAVPVVAEDILKVGILETEVQPNTTEHPVVHLTDGGLESDQLQTQKEYHPQDTAMATNPIVTQDFYVTKEKNTQSELEWDELLKEGETRFGVQLVDPVKDAIPNLITNTMETSRTTVVPGVDPVDEAKVRGLVKAVASCRSSHYILNNIQVPKSIFREIVKLKQHVSTNHMELMIGLIWDRFSNRLSENRAVLLGTAFCQFIMKDCENFKNNTGDEFTWDQNLVRMVNGSFFQREGRTRWLIDVDRVYAPMNWNDKHWVGLCIELTTGTVTVFDSAYNLNKPAKADEMMGPILDMLPLMISDLTADFQSEYTPPAVFLYERPADIPQDPTISGNCGPLSVKYMELHSQGIPFPNLTDKVVENIRMNYAVDVFEQFQYPLA